MAIKLNGPRYHSVTRTAAERLLAGEDYLGNIDYDERNRPVRARYDDGTTQTHVYDAMGRLSETSESGGQTPTKMTFTYDAVDRVAKIDTTTGSLTYTLLYEYDALDRIITRSLDTQGQREVTQYRYDKKGQVTEILYRGQSTRYDYDADTRLIKKTLPNGIGQHFLYDNAGRISEIRFEKSDGTVLDKLTYGVDARGNRIGKNQQGSTPATNETATVAQYDAGNRLTSLTLKGTGPLVDGQPTDETFVLSYDLNGNMTKKEGQGAASVKTATSLPHFRCFKAEVTW